MYFAESLGNSSTVCVYEEIKDVLSNISRNNLGNEIMDDFIRIEFN